MIGIEGMWGLLVYSIILPILTFTKCPEHIERLCPEKNGEYYFERPDVYLTQMFNSGIVLNLIIYIK